MGPFELAFQRQKISRLIAGTTSGPIIPCYQPRPIRTPAFCWWDAPWADYYSTNLIFIGILGEQKIRATGPCVSHAQSAEKGKIDWSVTIFATLTVDVAHQQMSCLRSDILVTRYDRQNLFGYALHFHRKTIAEFESQAAVGCGSWCTITENSTSWSLNSWWYRLPKQQSRSDMVLLCSPAASESLW